MAELIEAVLILLGCGLAVYWIGSLLSRGRAVAIFGMVLLLAVNPLTQYLGRYAMRAAVPNDLHRQIATPQTIRPDVRPDVVMIYLEGLEQTFDRADLFGDIYGQLLPLREDAMHFSRVAQVEGTGWTMAGLVATQCGLPLVAGGLRYPNSAAVQADFLGQHLCLGDVMAGVGYDNRFVLGSDVRFAAMERFLHAHQILRITDIHEIERNYPPDTLSAALGVPSYDDQLVFHQAKGVYDALVQQTDPMFLNVLTYGPHGNTAMLSRGCTDDGLARISRNEVPESVRCTISDAVAFVDHIRTARDGRPTVVVLMSDHLNHGTQVTQVLQGAERFNTVLFLALGYQPVFGGNGQVNDRPAASIDIYPTLLAFLGLAGRDARAGLGVSLFSDQPTLTEQKGTARLNAELHPNRALGRAIWY